MTGRVITDAEQAEILALIDRLGGQARPIDLRRLLDIGSVIVLNRLLEPLVDRGVLRKVELLNSRVWESAAVNVKDAQVVDAYCPQIAAHLDGVQDTARGVAAALNLPLREVTDTCHAMRQDGELHGTSVGNLWIFSRSPRVQERRIDPANMPLSPEARVRQQIAALPPLRLPPRPPAPSDRPAPDHDDVPPPPAPDLLAAAAAPPPAPEPEVECPPPVQVEPAPAEPDPPAEPAPPRPRRRMVDLALENQLRAELPHWPRTRPGETARIAQKYDISPRQISNALSRIPVHKETP